MSKKRMKEGTAQRQLRNLADKKMLVLINGKPHYFHVSAQAKQDNPAFYEWLIQRVKIYKSKDKAFSLRG